MKRIISLILTLVTLLSLTLMPAEARHDHGIEAGTATPTIDGYIDMEDDGWSEPYILNRETLNTCWKTAPITIEGSFCTAYSDKGLYYAIDIVEPIVPIKNNGYTTDSCGFVYSTGPDNLDADRNSGYGYNGDVMVFAFDIEHMLYNSGFDNNRSYSPWYMIGLFEGENGDEAKMYLERTTDNDGDITHKVEVAGRRTEDGWCAEAFLPWDMIIDDIEACVRNSPWVTADIRLDKESLANGGWSMAASVIYQDRFHDDEAGETATWNRYATVVDVLPDGTPGEVSSAIQVACYGIDVTMTDHSFRGKVAKKPTTYDAGRMSVYCTDCEKKIYEYSIPVEKSITEFDDVRRDKWYSFPIRYGNFNGYMKGIGDRLFDPDSTLTREMFVQMLFNLSPDNQFTYPDSGFSDIAEGAWYENAVAWAHKQKITAGIEEGCFGTGRAITRQEMTAILYNYADVYGYDTEDKAKLERFEDADMVAPWAVDAMKWGVYNKIVAGISNTMLSPAATSTRMEAAAVIYRFSVS